MVLGFKCVVINLEYYLIRTHEINEPSLNPYVAAP